MKEKYIYACLGLSSITVFSKLWLDISKVDCSELSGFTNDIRYILSFKGHKKLSNRTFVYFDEFEAIKKLGYGIAEQDEWINYKNSAMNLNVPSFCVARGTTLNLKNIIISKAFVIGYPIIIFNSKKFGHIKIHQDKFLIQKVQDQESLKKIQIKQFIQKCQQQTKKQFVENLYKINHYLSNKQQMNVQMKMKNFQISQIQNFDNELNSYASLFVVNDKENLRSQAKFEIYEIVKKECITNQLLDDIFDHSDQEDISTQSEEKSDEDSYISIQKLGCKENQIQQRDLQIFQSIIDKKAELENLNKNFFKNLKKRKIKKLSNKKVTFQLPNIKNSEIEQIQQNK